MNLHFILLFVTMEGFWCIAPIITALLATVLNVVCVSTNYWIQIGDATIGAHAGVWKFCVTFFDDGACASWKSDLSTLPAVKGLVLVSIILAVFAVTFEVKAYLDKKYVYVCTQGATGITALQGITLACGIFTYLAFVNNNDFGNEYNFSWSFALAWVAVGFYALAVIFFIVGLRKG
ncbi:lens fiber membrane intrinsic protein-like [Amphiura filiformis]|uniref:lens fiber membrane intrinsic protein-like n=1 Tax=Amphiura filiformis TaxID=82378 RepID=UPI003B22465F